jgi:hypothetical protein
MFIFIGYKNSSSLPLLAKVLFYSLGLPMVLLEKIFPEGFPEFLKNFDGLFLILIIIGSSLVF